MKDRIASFIAFIETATTETKKYEKYLEGIIEKISTEQNPDNKKQLASEHYAHTQYLMLLRQDILKSMNKLSECYTCCVMQKVELNLTDDEKKILDNYSEQSENIFGLVNNSIEPKHYDLLKLMLDQAKTIKEQPFIDSYIEQLIKK